MAIDERWKQLRANLDCVPPGWAQEIAEAALAGWIAAQAVLEENEDQHGENWRVKAGHLQAERDAVMADLSLATEQRDLELNARRTLEEEFEDLKELLAASQAEVKAIESSRDEWAKSAVAKNSELVLSQAEVARLQAIIDQPSRERPPYQPAGSGELQEGKR